jgi:hypothetical protein
VSSHYTDVDRLILERWNDVLDLQDAFKELTDRMRIAIDGALQKTERWLDEQGYRCEYDAKSPYISAWKPAWEAKRDKPCIRLQIADFAPSGYARNLADHPTLLVFTDDLALLKMKEPDRQRFARTLREALGPLAAKWDQASASDADQPLGRYLSDVSDARRIELVADPQQLQDLLRSSFADLFELSESIDVTLVKMRAK